MREFVLKFSTEYPNDLKSIIFSKREWGTYESKIEEFKSDIRTTLETLKTFPNIGSDVSSRVNKKTDLQYSLIHVKGHMMIDLLCITVLSVNLKMRC